MIQAFGTTSAVSYSYKYDNDGNLTLQTNPNGTSISSSYDLDGHLTQQLWYNSGGTLNNSLSYSYDGDGNLLTAGNNAGTYHFAYNADGEQTQVIMPSGVTLNYLYDASGNTTQVSDSLGDTVASQYDGNGNLLQRSASAFGAQAGVSFAYDGDGNITAAVRLALIGGVLQALGSSSYVYDAQGDATSIVYKNASGSTLDSFSYAYNAAGQVTREVDYNGSTTNYAYDATGQLTSAGTASYSYDANGNPNTTGKDTVGANNEVTSDGSWTYGYDLDGNLTSQVGLAGGADAGLSWTYSYDPNNELTSAVEKNSSNATLVSATYSYDVFGQRIQSSVSTGGSPVVTNYVYNGSTLWATLDSSDALQTFYVAGDGADQYLGQINTSSGGVYRTDRLGTVRDLVSSTGTVLDAIDYDAFGKVVSQTTASLAPLIGYAGYQWDSALGGDFTQSRIYLPSLGRFLTEDPTGLVPDSNLYRYAHNDPTNATDPSGLLQAPAAGEIEKIVGIGVRYFGSSQLAAPSRVGATSGLFSILTSGLHLSLVMSDEGFYREIMSSQWTKPNTEVLDRLDRLDTAIEQGKKTAQAVGVKIRVINDILIRARERPAPLRSAQPAVAPMLVRPIAALADLKIGGFVPPIPSRDGIAG